MSDEFNTDEQWDAQDDELQLEGDAEDSAQEFEEISSDEVDRVVGALETLMESTASENIKSHLEDALNSIYYLVYDEDSEEDDDEGEGDILVEAA